MKLAKNDKLIMIGDSITDCGRSPAGEGLFDAIGKGYVAQVDALLNSTYPDLLMRVVNKGTSGNNVRDLKNRWQSDVLDAKPDWLSIMIGINDVWRQYDQPLITDSHVYLDEYESTLHELARQTRPLVKGLVMMTPFYIEPLASDKMRVTMDEYGQAVKRVADANDAIFVDIQAAFGEVLKHIYPATLAWDRVHPNMIGHMTIARAFLNAVDYSWTGR